MPPSNKRSRDDVGGDDDEQRLNKGFKSSSSSTFPSHYAPPETASPDGPEQFVVHQNNSGGASTTSATKKPTSKNRNERQRLLKIKIAELNYNASKFAEKKLLDANSIANDAGYTDFAHRYITEADKIQREYNRSHGDVAVCGSGECGQLGLGESVLGIRRFKVVSGLRNQNISQLAAGGLHSAALSDNGDVFTWGMSDEGSLGVVTPSQDGFLPSQVKGFFPSQYGPNGTDGLQDAYGNILPFTQRPEANILQVVAGNTQCLALSSTGDVYAWGSIKDNEGRNFREVPPQDDTRPKVADIELEKVKSGDTELDFVTVPRGKNYYPVHLASMPGRVTALSCGENSNAAVLEDHTIVTWGVSIQGELCRPACALTKKTDNNDVIRDHLTPKPVVWAGMPNVKRKIVQISYGGWHLLVVTREGINNQLSVYSSGLNNYGQLGHGDTENRKQLTKVEFLEGKDIEMVEGTYHNSFFVGGGGKQLYSTGRGDYGCCGVTLESPTPEFFCSTPARVPLVYDVKTQGNISEPTKNCIVEDTIDEDAQPEIEHIAAGSSAHHCMVLCKNGDVYSWGYGENGQCGQNRTNDGEDDNDITLPKKMNLEMGKKTKKMRYKVKYLSGGGQHSAAIITTTDSF